MRTTRVRALLQAASIATLAAASGCSTCAGESAPTAPPAATATVAAPVTAAQSTAAIAPEPVAAAPQQPLDPLAVLPGRWVGLRSGHAIRITRRDDGASVARCEDPSEHEPCDEGTATELGATFRATFFDGYDEPEGEEADDAPLLYELELSLAPSGETMHVRVVRAGESTAVEEDYRQSDMLEWARDTTEADAAHQDFYANVVYRDDAEDDDEREEPPLDTHASVAADREILLAAERGALARVGRDPRALDGEAALRLEEHMLAIFDALGCGSFDRGYAECAPFGELATGLLAGFLRDGIEPRVLIGAVPATITVSSALPGRPAALMFDGELETAWNSAHGDLVGASIAIELPADARILEVLITPGYLRQDLFVENHRIARVRITHAGDPPREIDVPIDRDELVPLGLEGGGGLWTIEVLATRPGTRTDWTEICVSELRVIGTSPGRVERGGIAPTYQLAPSR